MRDSLLPGQKTQIPSGIARLADWPKAGYPIKPLYTGICANSLQGTLEAFK